MRGLSEKTKELITYCKKLLVEAHPQSVRQLHYLIFSKKELLPFPNTPASYKRVGRVTSKARVLFREWELAGEISPEPVLGIDGRWITDETRDPEMVSVWDDVDEYLKCVSLSYRRDAWQDQPTHVEVWSEKATVLGSLRPVAEKWAVTLRVCHGFGSTAMSQQIGRRFASVKYKDIHVLYLGDHDPSGRVIEQDMHSRVQEAAGVRFKIRRLAIHAGDIKQFNLPPQRIKNTDSRASSFRKRYGKNAATVELDALPVPELRRRVETAIKNLIDFDLWERQLATEGAEFDSIRRVAAAMKNLPQLGGGPAEEEL